MTLNCKHNRTHNSTKPIDHTQLHVNMGVGRIFSRGATRGFFQTVSRGDQKWWNLFFGPWNWKNNLFLLKFSKSEGCQGPPFRHPCM